MEMTYAALAKSLGISLKPISSTSNTSSSASSLPATSHQVPPESSDASPSGGGINVSPSSASVGSKTQAGEQKPEERSTEDNPTSEQRSRAPSGTKETGNSGSLMAGQRAVESSKHPDLDDNVVEDPGSDVDAEGISDSDIASSRPSSPNLVPAQESSLEENAAENVPQSAPAELRTISQGTENGPDLTVSESEYLAVPQEKMSDEQLHRAKVLVLDLLGWGVPPEYLLQRGISHALLYTVFTDLRLRLPDAIFEDCVKLVSAQS